MTQPHHRHRHPKYKKRYKLTNWRSYVQSLVNRGDLTLWLSDLCMRPRAEDTELAELDT